MIIEDIEAGSVFCYERTFTLEDVQQFSAISGDEGDHHMVPDEYGRVVVHGFLTATLPTKIGGDFNVVARDFTMKFVRPVFTGDTIRCEVTMHRIEKQEQ
ncbi:hotdog domain-containing protein [Thermoactinomyces sp. DSM 45892]|uniref:hotdog domain-containing protein n=1 Tax=Thermoactinomyces sp. DSM 45892 TaxID=1882753 RepID=UPI00089D66A4|nr:MaoC like domain-containing protein [Thermoactinomyces sp. DSM 45892]